MAKTTDLGAQNKVKVCFDDKKFDVANWVASISRKMVPKGRHHIRPFQLQLKENCKFPQSLTGDKILSMGIQGFRPSSQRQQHTDLHRRLKRRLGCSFRRRLSNRSVVGWGKGQHKFTSTKGRIFGLKSFQHSVSKSDSVDCHGQFNIVAKINKQGGTNPVEMCALLWRIMT